LEGCLLDGVLKRNGGSITTFIAPFAGQKNNVPGTMKLDFTCVKLAVLSIYSTGITTKTELAACNHH
jgi:hypothetical protein